jgi:CheY-like chemotaxis protein
MAGELILIVEDNARSRKLARDVLQYKGYQTVETETGEEALQLARTLHPALILMDIQLPGIDGITALPPRRFGCHRFCNREIGSERFLAAGSGGAP